MKFDTNHTAEQYFTKSYGFLRSKELPEVIHLCKKALSLNPKHRDSYLRLGNVFSTLQRYNEAEDYYNRFLKQSSEAQDQFDISRAYNAIGYLHSLKKEVKEALRHYYLSLDIAKTLAKPREVARCYNNIALAHRIERKYERAYYFYQKALDISKKANHTDRVAYYYFNIAIMFKEQKKYIKGRWYLRKFNKLYKLLKKKGIYLLPQDALSEQE